MLGNSLHIASRLNQLHKTEFSAKFVLHIALWKFWEFNTFQLIQSILKGRQIREEEL